MIGYKSYCTSIPSVGNIWNVILTKPDILKIFYVQNINDAKFIQQMCSRLDELDEKKSKPLIDTVHVGQLIAASYVNGSWYRAKVIKKDNLGLYVCFIDFNDDVVFVTDYRILPEELVDVKPMAYKCYINYSSRVIEQIFLNSDFNKLITTFLSNNEMAIKFINKQEPYVVTLSYNGKRIVDIISELFWEGIMPGILDDPINLKRLIMLNKINLFDDIEVVKIKPIISTEHFFIELKSNNKLRTNIRDSIKNEKNWIPILNPKDGELVIARKNKESKLYRARSILKCATGIEYKCFLIDCGRFENCSEFFEPNIYLQSVPPVKIHCSLKLSTKCSTNLLESISLGFIDEINNFKNDMKSVQFTKVGSPCKVNIKINGLELREIIKPYNVTISHANNILDLNYFKARMVSSEVERMKQILKSTVNFSKVTNPQIFNIYVAKHKNHYKRVKLFFIYDNYYEVKLVDGSNMRVPVKELYKLPKSLENIKILDIYCSLGINKTKYSNEKLSALSNNGKTIFSMVVIKHNNENGHLVKLFLNSKDVETLIAL
ncbi:Hemocyanin, N-terminal,Tudor domain [Cinara cedri]|uniref:Hemocyanin, N-terminal,Tudor domain n=1 Tax=Cinara cedri TaxID=506608 RepID=A0A5E4NFW3_9HEMI|nr:Hemocyanin, N-terminal,Tudor domain [Cinara cedri]